MKRLGGAVEKLEYAVGKRWRGVAGQRPSRADLEVGGGAVRAGGELQVDGVWCGGGPVLQSSVGDQS